MLDDVIDTNLKVPFILSRSLLPSLRQSDNASIVNVGSVAANSGVGGICAYSASKWGLQGLTLSLAAELESESIRVVMLSPSPVDTPMRWEVTPNWDPNALVQPETIAQLVRTVADLPAGITTNGIAIESMKLRSILTSGRREALGKMLSCG